MIQKTFLLVVLVAGLSLVLAACQGQTTHPAQNAPDLGGAAAGTPGAPGAQDAVGNAADQFSVDLNQINATAGTSDVNITAADLDLGLQ